MKAVFIPDGPMIFEFIQHYCCSARKGEKIITKNTTAAVTTTKTTMMECQADEEIRDPKLEAKETTEKAPMEVS